MRPGRPPAQEPDGLFKTPLDRFIDMGHPLVRLADRIDWEGLETQVASCFAETGRPATPARFALGMLMLKAMHDLCDEALWERWPCDPYFQYFTGELYFQHKVPHERSGLSHWRGRLGPEVLDELIRESLRVAHATGALSGRDMAAVSVNTTVQEKAARFPTDAGLLYQALVRVGKRAQIKAGRYAHAKQFNRRNRMIRVLRTRLGRVIRDIERKIAGDDELAARFADSLAKARAIRDQVLVRRATTGGAQDLFLARPRSRVHQQGQGAGSLRVRLQGDHHHHQRTGQGRQFVLHAAALHGNPFDGHTLGRVLAATAELTGVTPKRVHVDKGYRGHRQDRAVFDAETRRDVRPPWRGGRASSLQPESPASTRHPPRRRGISRHPMGFPPARE